MHPPTFDRRGALLALGSLVLMPANSWGAPAGTPGDSIYQLQASLVDQDGREFELSSLRGSPVLAGMFYTSCDKVCPMIFESIHSTLRALPASERQAVRILLVTFDPARDVVAVLKKTAEAHACDAQWTLARGDETIVRKLAAALGIQYRRLSSGEFNHSATIDLLDKEGRIAARSGKLGSADPALIKAVHQAQVARA